MSKYFSSGNRGREMLRYKYSGYIQANKLNNAFSVIKSFKYLTPVNEISLVLMN